MAEAGVFRDDEHVELLRGEVVEMSPHGLGHVIAMERANEMLVAAYLGSPFAVRPQSTHLAGEISAPEPDLVVVPRAVNAHVDVGDSLLVVEVADSSLAKDRKVKRSIYAEAGAPRYWIVEISKRIIRLLEDPHGGDYHTERVVASEGTLTLPFIDIEVRAADLLPIG